MRNRGVAALARVDLDPYGEGGEVLADDRVSGLVRVRARARARARVRARARARARVRARVGVRIRVRARVGVRIRVSRIRPPPRASRARACRPSMGG